MKLHFPKTITHIGDYAFYYCESLKSVTIPESVTSIGNEAFANCTSLESITIENPDCEIYDDKGTISSGYDFNKFEYYFDGTIYGYSGSTAQSYAEKYGYKFESLGGYEPETIKGDISGNGEIDLYDVIEIAKFLIHKVDFTEEQMKIADFNEDDVVDLYDAIYIAKYILEHREK